MKIDEYFVKVVVGFLCPDGLCRKYLTTEFNEHCWENIFDTIEEDKLYQIEILIGGKKLIHWYKASFNNEKKWYVYHLRKRLQTPPRDFKTAKRQVNCWRRLKIENR